MITSVLPSKTSENIYSAQSCLKASDYQTEPKLKGSLKSSALPLERASILAPFTRSENTIVSAGGCRFIAGPPGAYQCGCRDPRQCHKDHNAAVCELTPRCFSYHDRHVQAVPA